MKEKKNKEGRLTAVDGDIILTSVSSYLLAQVDNLGTSQLLLNSS